MDPLEALLAKMAKATGNAPVAATPEKHDSSANTTTLSSKRERSEDEKPETTAAAGGIWNPNVMQELENVAPAKGPLVTPPMEIARQQTVRQLCNKIRRVSEEMGISKLPNSTYETWQFTSKLTVSEVRSSSSWQIR